MLIELSVYKLNFIVVRRAPVLPYCLYFEKILREESLEKSLIPTCKQGTLASCITHQ